MSEEPLQTAVAETRKLAAIMFTDIVDFSRQMGTDEARMLRVLTVHNQIIEQAMAEAERAIALSPNDADLHRVLAEVLALTGRPEEAIGEIEKAIRLNPHSPAIYLYILGRDYHLTGRYEEALATLKKALTRDPDFQFTHLQLAAIYSELGREDEARAEAAEVLRINPNFSLEFLRQNAPFKDPAVLERQIDSMRKAGLK
ncbi:MAG TPA: tetratricopeptide repeat protein [Candidatus Binatia bacterium]|jgi:tetratricopeptide (TPR) repeat protein|nr:tetratricopeptide repeat protein [Candidatus Binatia bacterium]